MRRLLVIACALAVGTPRGRPVDPAALPQLGPHGTVRGELGPGRSERIALAARAGEAVELRLDVDRADFEVRLLRADGDPALWIDEPFAQLLGPTSYRMDLVAIASDEGPTLIELTGLPNSDAGSYRVTRTASREATPADRVWADGLRAYQDGAQLLGADDEGPAPARRRFADAARDFSRAGRPREAGIATVMQGSAAFVQGDYPEAIAQFERARTWFHAAGDTFDEGRCDLRIGVAYIATGTLDMADQHVRAARDHALHNGDTDALGFAFHDLGIIAERRGSYSDAEAYLRQALHCFEEVGDDNGMQGVHLGLGRLYRRFGDAARSLKELRRSLAYEAQPNAAVGRADALYEMGRTQLELTDNADGARSVLAAAETIQRTTGYRRNLARTLLAEARVCERDDDRTTALARASEALEIARSIGAVPDQIEAHDVIGSISLPVEPAVAAVHAEQALALGAGAAARLDAHLLLARAARAGGDRVRARQALAEAVTEVERMRGSIRDLDERIHWFATARDVYLELADLAMEDGDPVAAFRASEEARARSLLDRVGAPGVAPATLDPERWAKDRLDPDTAIIELMLGERRSYAWVLTRDGLRTYRLPDRRTIDRAVVRWLAALADPRDAAGAEVAALVLGPLEGELRGRRRLIIVPDGSLWSAPLVALPMPSGQPLVSEHEIELARSVTLLTRSRATGAPSRFAVIADPVYAPDDERVARPRAPAGPTYARLAASRDEAQAIAALARPGTTSLFLDFDAARQVLSRPEVTGADVLHIAAHASADGQNPTASSLVLSTVTRRGDPVAGRVTAGEIRDLHLSARLVVLSACESALGHHVDGEGMLGLAHAFHLAGVPEVLASLWPVDDVATSALMRRFYAYLLAGARPSAALRGAINTVRADGRWRAPRDWSAFELYTTTLD